MLTSSGTNPACELPSNPLELLYRHSHRKNDHDSVLRRGEGYIVGVIAISTNSIIQSMSYCPTHTGYDTLVLFIAHC